MNRTQRKTLSKLVGELREQLEAARGTASQIEEVASAAEEALDNMPESLRYNSDRGAEAEEQFESLSSAHSDIESALDELESAIDEIDNLT